MGGGGKRGGGERVLESRHLVGLFLGVVLLCGVFFTLGYVMGRTQFSGSVHAADAFPRVVPVPTETVPKKAKEDAGNSAAAPAGEWDFSKPDNDRLEPAANPAGSGAAEAKGSGAPAARPVPVAARPPSKYQSPFIPKGDVVLQLAALKRESDALALADAVQQKRFPSFVVSPGGDNLYRVQVGPYPDEKTAEAAKQALAKAGFNAIIKR